MRGNARRGRRTLFSGAAVAALLAVIGSLVLAGPAVAADTAVLDIATSVDKSAVVPGQSFTYTISPGCSSAGCQNATVTDVLPPEFDPFTLNPNVVITGAAATSSWGGTNNRTLTVRFTDALNEGGTGLQDGSAPSIQISLSVPAGLTPDWPSNGQPVTDTATVVADNAAAKSAGATTTVTIPYTPAVTASASWAPSTTQYKVGEASTLTVGVRNTSNGGAQSLLLTVPTDPTASSDLFDSVDLSGLGAATFPAGADLVQVDAYVGGAWIPGAPAAAAALPDGVSPGDVTGLRFTFTSSSGATAITANGAAGSVALLLAQRSSTRAAGTALVNGATVTAAVSATVSLGSHGTATNAASATYRIGGLTAAVTGVTSFATPRIPAGTSAQVVLGGTNTSNGPLSTFVLTEPANGTLLGPKVTFGGFGANASWPGGATAATLHWMVSGGTQPDDVALNATSALPSPPTPDSGQSITGFSITYTGSIAAGSTASVPFSVDVAKDIAGSASAPATVTQTGWVDGHNDAGDATRAVPTAALTVLYPQVALSLTKSITPSAAKPIPAGGRSVVQLRATTSSDSGYVHPTSVVITDAATGGAADYWSAFDVVAVAPTPVPAGASLTVSTTADGSTWDTVATVPASSTASYFQTNLTNASSIVGIRFAFADTDGFAQSSTLQGNLAFIARSTLRGSSDPTASSSNVSYTNAATATATGDVVIDGQGAVTATAASSSAAVIMPLGGGAGGGGVLAGKSWNVATVNAQSGDGATATVTWGTEISGYSTAVISEPADPTAPVASTVFQTFNLTRLNAITTATDPLMAYDQIAAVELYNGTGWTDITSSVCTSAAVCRGGMPAYTLSAAQQSSTVGVRITVTEWAGGRGTDPLSPPIGSGVASGPDSRPMSFGFQLRNTVRDASAMADPSTPWVTGSRTYQGNQDAGVVTNTARVALDAQSATASADVDILDTTPGVQLSKTASRSSLAIPVAGDIPSGNYPTDVFTLTANNTAPAKAWALRVTDQAPCAGGSPADCAHLTAGGVPGWTVDPYAGRVWDPATSPYDALTITKIAPSGYGGSTGIDASASKIELWYADGHTAIVGLTSSTLTTASALADVVGVSVLWIGADQSNGGTIPSSSRPVLTITTQLRATLRSAPATAVTPRTVTNTAFAESWDGVENDTAAYLTRSVDIALSDAALAVTTSKTFSPTSLLEKDRSANVTVGLTAASNGAAATASPSQVTVQDVRPEFWNAFQLVSLGTVPLPAGANRVEVDVQQNGSSSWIAGSAAAAAALPSSVGDPSTVTGIRFVFTNVTSDPGNPSRLFSVADPASPWSTTIPFTVKLRDAQLGGGAIVFPSSIPDDVTTTAGNPHLADVSATATTSIALNPGTFQVDISKTPSVATSPAGQSIDWTLVMTNTGTGYLTNPVVTDVLPSDGSLVWDPTSEISYTVSAGGLLPTSGQAVAYDPATRSISVRWPAGSRMAPGEKDTLVIPISIQAGLQAAHGPSVNQFRFSSDRSLSGCTNSISGNGQGVTFTANATSCLTQNSVSTISASAISSFKGVKGDVDGSGVSTRGAVNVNDPATPCVADPEGYYRQPCAANTVIGGTDQWKLQIVNGGNVPATGATIVDVLPRPGDTYLRAGTSRGSTYRPVFAGGVALATDVLSAGATMTWQATTSASPCPSWDTDSLCSGATWVDGASLSAASLARVTAIRVVFDFSGIADASPAGTLPPAATLGVTYRTVNQPSTTASDHLAPTTVPARGAQAWNSFGVWAQFGSGYTDRRVEPVRAGVQLLTGPVQVTKVLTGAGAAFAPTSYAAGLDCTVDGAPVTLPSGGAITLAQGAGYTTRIDGIPLGSDCRVVEAASGASSTVYSPVATTGTGAELAVATAAGSSDPVPAAQQATITNSYGTTSLVVTKQVATTATVGAPTGPFAFTLSCTADTGSGTLSVPLAAGDAAFTLADGDSHAISGLPVTATCALAETDSDHADRIQVSVDGAGATLASEGGATAIALGTNAEYDAMVTNVYDGGRLAVSKVVTGAGAEEYGTGPFRVAVDCTYQGQHVQTTTVTLGAGETTTLSPVMPAGTLCDLSETDAGGATTPAADGSVLIQGPSGPQTVGLTTAVLTNRFDTGSVELDKTITGAGAADWGAGPFEATLTCSWVRDGVVLDIPLPNGGVVALDAANGYRATVTGLIGGADCQAVETRTAGATIATVGAMSPSSVPVGGTATIALSNEFDVQDLTITKVQTGDGVDAYGGGSYTASVACTLDEDGTSVPLDLGSQASVTLSPGHYTQTVRGLPVGAACAVAETDQGLAVSSSLSPDGGVVTIESARPAAVTITNTFLLGSLSLRKQASASVVQGGTAFDYTIDVANSGEVAAAGVHVADPLDPSLSVTGIDADGWTCQVSGADADGYGGTLGCDLGTAPGVLLGVGASAPRITVHVAVRPTIAQDALDNTATVTSTTPVVTGAHDTVSTPVKWLDATITPICVKDAPWLQYSVDPRNVGTAGRTMTVEWLNASGDVVHTDRVTLDGGEPITGTLLWPGAQVDPSTGHGIRWPGWRAVTPGETPQWENLVEDPTLPEYGLRSGGSVRISINPTTTLPLSYPSPSSGCGDPSGHPAPDLWFQKTATTGNMRVGATVDYVLEAGNSGLGAADDVQIVDPIPASMKVVSVAPGAAADPSSPAWTGCVVTGSDRSGYGGTLTCTLDRPLGALVDAPPVTLTTRLNPRAGFGAITNTAHVTGTDIDSQLPTLAEHDSATVWTAGAALAFTGMDPRAVIITGALLLLAGLCALLVALVRRRRMSR